MTPSTPSSPAPAGAYADVNGLHLYYERTGTPHADGVPLIVLHGGFGSGGMFGGGLTPALSANREVIAVDLQGHGRTGDTDRPLDYGAMADDVAALLHTLDIPQADVLGYSLGGGVALQTAFRHPDVVRRLVAVSTPFRQSAWYAASRENMAQMGEHTAAFMLDTPIYEQYARVAPRPQDWARLWGKMGELLRREYDWTPQVAALRTPTLLVAGDADSFAPAHAAEFFALLGGGQRDGGWDGSGLTPHRLALLPATTHYDIFMSPRLAEAVTAFLDAPVPERP